MALAVDYGPTLAIETLQTIFYLKEYGLKGFHDGASALAAFKPGVYDIAFIDIKTNDMGDFELLKILKELDPNLEVVIITAYATEKSHARAIELGALEYLRKPFLMEEIYELVDRAIEKRKQGKNNNGNQGAINA